MFPKAYIFYTVPNVNMYFHVKTANTSNVKLTRYNPYMLHNPDVQHMWSIAMFQHPETTFESVLVIPNINVNTLGYANFAKDKEAIYCVTSESDLAVLDTISSEIMDFGISMSKFFNGEDIDLLREAVHRHFIQSQYPV